MEARLAHPIFDAVRPWLERLGGERSLERLNALAEEARLHTESGRPVCFVPPQAHSRYYEMEVFETGRVSTRPESAHDFFNALAWLSFPRTKARLNAMHAAQIPLENGRRSRHRDLLTLLDEGGVIIETEDALLAQLVRERRWKSLFWTERARVLRHMRFIVLGHATLEQALNPWAGIACKAVFVAPDEDADAAVAKWLGELPAHATPKSLPAVPIFGYPGWFPGNKRAEFYDDGRYFREKLGTAAPVPPAPLPGGVRAPLA